MIDRFACDFFSFFGAFKHDAVMIFFVLFGYVISYVASHKDKNIEDYFISRLSRLYSVVIPAIVITIGCDQIGRQLSETLYLSVYSDSHSIIRIFSNLFFVQEFWGAGIRLFSNGPFWSFLVVEL